MKGVILAGGTGSRLFPITFSTPKQLIPVGNKPVLKHIVDDLVNAGITEIGIILGQKGREEIQETIGDGSMFGADVTYIVQGKPLGIAHAIGCTRDFVGADPFVVYLGDIMVEHDISDLVDSFDPSREVARIGLQPVENPSRYGIANTSGHSDRITGFTEKPDDAKNDLASIGISAYTPRIFDEIEVIKPSWRGELELSDANRRLADEDYRLTAHVVDGWWRDTGTPEDMLDVNELVLKRDNTNQISESASIADSAKLRPPVAIGEDVIINGDATVGPYASIADEAEIDSAIVDRSIIMRGARIGKSVRLTESIVGEHADLKAKDRPGSSVVVADESDLRI